MATSDGSPKGELSVSPVLVLGSAHGPKGGRVAATASPASLPHLTPHVGSLLKATSTQTAGLCNIVTTYRRASVGSLLRREQKKEQKIAFVLDLIFTSQTLPKRCVIYSSSSSNVHQLPWTS